MNVSSPLEYLCPHCGCINRLEHARVVDMYAEQTAYCQQCQTKLEIVAADGINDAVNLIVSVAEDAPMR